MKTQFIKKKEDSTFSGKKRPCSSNKIEISDYKITEPDENTLKTSLFLQNENIIPHLQCEIRPQSVENYINENNVLLLKKYLL